MPNVELNIIVNSTLDEELRKSADAADELQKSSSTLSTTVQKGFEGAAKSAQKLTSEEIKQKKAVDGVTDEFEKMSKAKKKASDPKGVKKLNKELDKTSKKAKSAGGSLKGIGGLLKGAFGPLTAIFAGGALVGNAIGTIRQFGKSLDELASITGLDQTSEGFKTLESEAKRLGSTTTLSATEVVEAFKVVGSAKPELLANADALAAVTASTITLSEASGEDLATSVGTVTNILNQFGKDASETGNIIDILANGSKLGSANIGNIGEAITKFGVSAKASNINITESVAAIEVLAKGGLQGAEAGTKLSRVFSDIAGIKGLPAEAQEQLAKFGVNTDIVADSTLSLEDRLKELSKVADDPVAKVKIFGEANKDAAKILLDSVSATEGQTSELSKLTDGYTTIVDGQEVFIEGLERQGTAQEQADQNTDNLDGALKSLSSAWEGLVLEFSSGESVLQGIIEGIVDFVNVIKNNLGTIVKVMVPVLAVLAAYKIATVATAVATKVAAIAQKAWLIATKALQAAQKIATAAQWAFNAAMNANPIGAFLLLAAALVATLFVVSQAFNKSNSEMEDAALKAKLVEDATSKLSKAFTEEATEVDKVFNKLGDVNTTREEQLELLDQLESQYDVTLDDYKDENGLLIDLEGAQRAVNEAVLANIVAKQKAEAQNKLYAQSIKDEVSVANLAAGVTDEGADEIVGIFDKIGLALTEQFENPFGALDVGLTFVTEGSEAASEKQQIISDRLQAKINAKAKESLEQRQADTKAELEVLDEVYDAAGKAVQNNLGDLASGFADGLVEDTSKVKEEAAKLTAEQKKEADKRRKQRLQEANALFKVEEDLRKAIEALQKKAAKASEAGLNESQLIDLREKQALEEIALLEDALKEKIALIELEKEFTKEQLAKLSKEEIQARTNAFKEVAELNEDEVELLNQLRAASLSKANDERIELARTNSDNLNKAESDLIAERVTQQAALEEQLILDLESKSGDFSSELAFEAFKEEETLRIRRAGLGERISLIEQETELRLMALDLELAGLEGKEDAESKIRKEALETQKENLKIARDNQTKSLDNEGQDVTKKLDEIASEKLKFNLAKALGIDPEDLGPLLEAISEFGGAIVGEINNTLNSQLDANSKLIDSLGANIDDTEAALDREIAKRDAGFASNIAGKEEELEALKAAEQDAQKEREKLVKQQLLLDTVQQASGLITTSVSILRGFATIPIVGLPLGIAAVAAMLGFFIKAKATAFSAAGFHGGGFTGHGNEYDIAGPVHKEEFVSTKKTTQKYRDLLELMHNDDDIGINQYMKDVLHERGISLDPDTPERMEKKIVQVRTIRREQAGEANQKELLAKVDALTEEVSSFKKVFNDRPERWSDQEFDYLKQGNTTRKKPRKQ